MPCFCRSWQPRHIFWTKEKIYFTRRNPKLGEIDNTSPYLDTIIDSIPLDEIVSVNDPEDTISVSTSDPFTFNRFSKLLNSFYERDTSGIRNAPGVRNTARRGSSSYLSENLTTTGQLTQNSSIQIRTETYGFNSGRTYYIRIAGGQQGYAIASLSSLCRVARQNKEAITRFRKNQEAVRRVYCSAPVQYLIAALIAAVRPPAPRASRHRTRPLVMAAPSPRHHPSPAARRPAGSPLGPSLQVNLPRS